MILLKKLIFAPIFLMLFTLLIFISAPFFSNLDLIFSLDLQNFYQLITLSSLILFCALAFNVFVALSSDWKIILPACFLSALIPFLFTPPSLALVLSVEILVILSLSFMMIESKMKSYLTFKPSTLLSPSIKQLATLLILALSVTYYLSINQIISEKGFEIPDSLIDSALKLMPQTNLSIQGVRFEKSLIAQLPQITPEQIELLKKNPELLKQYNIDPKMLDSIPVSTAKPGNVIQQPAPSNTSNPAIEMVKPLIKEQLQSIVKPYQGIIPALLALLLFLSLQSLVSLLSIFLSPLLWLTFWILEKINFIRFETEMREVKKMVV